MKAFSVGIALCIMVSVCCGCETVTVMRSGELTMEDLKTMVNYGFNIQPPQPPRPSADGQPAEVRTGTPLIKRVQHMDAWFRENLW